MISVKDPSVRWRLGSTFDLLQEVKPCWALEDFAFGFYA